jgi:2-amino-4-hydroxy-6-hydroxymethyldihydropteridine diphosphokinase
LNAVVVMEPLGGETPEGLLRRFQGLEREFGRGAKVVVNEPRPLDVDLIAFGTEVRCGPELTLPHPRAVVRRFVLAPMCEVVPDYVFPGQARTVRELLEALPVVERVERWEGGSSQGWSVNR